MVFEDMASKYFFVWPPEWPEREAAADHQHYTARTDLLILFTPVLKSLFELLKSREYQYTFLWCNFVYFMSSDAKESKRRHKSKNSEMGQTFWFGV